MKTLFPNSFVKSFSATYFKSKHVSLEKVNMICQLLPKEQTLELDIHIKNILCRKGSNIRYLQRSNRLGEF